MMTDKQEQFCQEYVVDFCGRQAAIRAGYSPATATEQASQLLKLDDVQARVTELRRDKIDRTQLRADRVIEELLAIAFADLSDVLDWGPSGYILKPGAELTAEQSKAVLEVSETVSKMGITRSIKLHPKVRALELLMKHLGLLAENVNVKHSGELRYIAPTVKKPGEGGDATT